MTTRPGGLLMGLVENVASLMPASSNHVALWLGQIDGLRLAGQSSSSRRAHEGPMDDDNRAIHRFPPSRSRYFLSLGGDGAA